MSGLAAGGGLAPAKQTYGPALIDDDTRTPGYAHFSWTGLIGATVFAVGLGLAAWMAFAGITGVDQGNLPSREPARCLRERGVRRDRLYLPPILPVHPRGRPVVDSTRGNIRLTAISAAVVGVVMSLAVFFAWHVFRLDKSVAQWDWTAIGVTLGACIAAFRFKVGAIPSIFTCAAPGLVLSYVSR